MNNNMQFYLVDADDATKRMSLNSPEEFIYLRPDITGLTELPGIRSTTGVNVGTDGGWTSAQLFDARLITVKGVIAHQDVAVVERKRRELNAMLAKRRLRLNMVTEGGSEFTVMARVMNVAMPMKAVLTAQEFKIDFRADDPLIYDNSTGGDLVATLYVRQVLGGFRIPFKFPIRFSGGGGESMIVNSGSSPVYPIIELRGPLHSPTIVNATANQQMQIFKDITADDVILIDSSMQTITLNGVDIFDSKSEASSFLTIAPGRNRIYLQSEINSDKGSAKIRYKSGFYSI